MKFEFKTALAEDVFRKKYAHDPEDTWPMLARRVVEDVCGTRWGTTSPLMAKSDRDQLAQYIMEMKFVPGGRYLYYAGRDAKYFNNCFSGDTRYLSEEGYKTFKDTVGQELRILSPQYGEYLYATVKSFGKQQLQEITFVPLRGYSSVEYKIKATRTHRWPLMDGSDTYDLRVGDQVPANGESGYSYEGYLHGVIFGDGTKEATNKDGTHTFKLHCCDDSTKSMISEMKRYADVCGIKWTESFPPTAKGDPILRFWSKEEWKELPTNRNADRVGGFIDGWLLADGTKVGPKALMSVNKEALEFFREYCPAAGLVPSGNLRYQDRDTNFKKNSRIYIQNYSYGCDWQGFKVKSIEQLGEEEVYCLVEPKYNKFILDYGIQTFNCYCLKAEKDTREEWAALTERSMSALMSGGGIGIDYSLLRPSGYRLRRTGGISSGPIPLMRAINELGRAAIQGGTRRSAIWAGLNWQHEDVEEFLYSKDWSEAVLYCKGQDFDFPAPLDQTNISVLWDTDFAEDYRGLSEEGWELPSLWYDSVEQMCKTGEPGHCYNFYDQEMDTLRNACTEFISDQDSDVCNLGSINLGAIGSIGELTDVVDLASRFLVCGTMRADLPYPKVKEVRDEYRKIGLGIMGFHEWLLQRGYNYSVPAELAEWLGVYRDQSEKSATEHAERFFIPTPRAFRAIAPAGTIGILASTTTGIEPLYSVAAKRRYLRAGTWKYQYEVSPTADRIIKETGCSPDDIETAGTLARDVRRRIDVQATIQDYVDMGISSTLNLPAWGTEYNNEDTARDLAHTLAEFCDRLRGITCYPDGARFGQPIEEVDYEFAKEQEGVIFDERDDNCKGGTCGV